MSDEMNFAGRSVLVTGSGRNIGRAIVLEFAARGANVVVNARQNRQQAEAVAEEARALGASALVVLGDVSDLRTVQEMKAMVERSFGRLDIYVSNAARRLFKDFFETTDDEWHWHLNQQLTASWYLAKAFVPGMIEAGWGRIIHVNGPDGWHGGWNRIPHSVAKGGLRTLTKSLASGLGRYGVTVNDLNPGLVDTVRDPLTHPMRGDAQEQIGRIPIRRQPTPSELAWACTFLASPRSGAINGAVLTVDGGMWMEP